MGNSVCYLCSVNFLKMSFVCILYKKEFTQYFIAGNENPIFNYSSSLESMEKERNE